jgi:hypothetical protein
MKDNFTVKGYLVTRGRDDTFLSLQKSTGAIGQAPQTNWDKEPTGDSIFTDLSVAKEYAKKHDGQVIECELDVSVREPVG